jgi:hypothetical protein
MALVYANTFSTSFAGVTGLQSQGIITTGAASPSGISDGISIVNGVYRAKITDADTQTASGIRSELVFADNALGDNEFIDFELLIKDAEWAETGSTSDRMVVFQVHNEDSITAAVNFLLWVEDRTLVAWYPSSEPPTEGSTYIARSLAPFIFDTWHRITLRVRWVNASTGFLDLYLNQRPIFRVQSRGTAYNSDTPYPKLGLYASGSTGFGTRMAYYRNFAHYRGAAESFATVMSTTPRPTAALLA